MRASLGGTGSGAAILAGCVVLGIVAATPASAGAATRTFKPVDSKRHALIFAPRDVPADAVRAARVRLQNRRTDRSRTRPVALAKVRGALVHGSRIRIWKAPRAKGRLKIRIAGEHRPPPPSSGDLPTRWRRFASFEADLNEDTDLGWNIPSPFNVTRTSEVGGVDGAHAAKIVTNGGSGGCSCPRMKFEDGFSYGVGDDVWIGGSWYVTDRSKISWSRLMNLGHWSGDGASTNYVVGLIVNEPGQMSVRARYYDTEEGWSVLMANRPIPEGRWFSVDIHLKLSPHDGQALTEVYLDGQPVATSTARNMMNSGSLHFFNAGLSYFLPDNGNTTVYFDAARLAP
jgi:Polysaccharide lyase